MRRAVVLCVILTMSLALALNAQTSSTSPTAKKSPTKSTAPKPRPKAPVAQAKTITTPSGLQYLDLIEGKGATPKVGDLVVVHYTGRFTNGKVFDSSVGKRPFEFALG